MKGKSREIDGMSRTAKSVSDFLKFRMVCYNKPIERRAGEEVKQSGELFPIRPYHKRRS